MKKTNPLGFRVESEDTIKTGKFIIYFVLAYLFLSSVFYFIVPLQSVEEAVAGATLLFLNSIGFSGEIVPAEPVLIQLDNGIGIAISELCTGLMELFIIVSAIIASAGIEWRKRLLGVIASVIVLQVFNFARIFATLLVILGSASLQTIEFTHNILFRVFLFVVIAGTYLAWFYWAVKK